MKRRRALGLALLVALLALLALQRFLSEDRAGDDRMTRPGAGSMQPVEARRHSGEPSPQPIAEVAAAEPRADEEPSSEDEADLPLLVLRVLVDDGRPAEVGGVEAILQDEAGEESRLAMTARGEDTFELTCPVGRTLVGVAIEPADERPYVFGDYPMGPLLIDRDLVHAIRLSTEPRLLGYVVEAPGGEPIEGAVVTASDEGRSPLRQVRTDSLGRFDLVALRDLVQEEVDVLVLAVEHEGFVPVERGVVLPEPNGRRENLLVRLERGHRVAGIVVDESGRGIGGARLELFGFGSTDDGGDPAALTVHHRLSCDSEGRFRTPPLPSLERLAILFEHRDQGAGFVELGALREERRDLRLVLHREARLQLRAIFPDGSVQDAADLDVWIKHPRLGWISRTGYGAADKRSNFRVPLGARVEARAFRRRREGGGTVDWVARDQISVDRDEQVVDLRLQRSVSDERVARARFDTDSPADVVLRLRFRRDGAFISSGRLVFRSLRGGRMTFDFDGADGTTLMIPPGRYPIEVGVEGLEPKRLLLDEAPGATLDLILDLESGSDRP